MAKRTATKDRMQELLDAAWPRSPNILSPFISFEEDQRQVEKYRIEPINYISKFLKIKTMRAGGDNGLVKAEQSDLERVGTPEIVRLVPNDAQRYLYEVIMEVWRQGLPVRIVILKARQTGMCCIEGTPVLTSGLTWVPIEKIEVGQRLIAVDEEEPRGYVGAVVEGTRQLVRRVYRLHMDDGKTLTATGEHRFLCSVLGRKWDAGDWRRVNTIAIGDRIRYIGEMTETFGSSGGWRQVMAIDEVGKRPVYDLQTSSKTFIANGFVSHNSTFTEAFLYGMTRLWPNTNSMVVADEEERSEIIFQMAQLFHDQLPAWMKYPTTRRNKGLIRYENTVEALRGANPGLLSEMRVSWASKRGFNLGRGHTLRGLHLSELSSYPDQEKAFNSVMQALADEMYTLGVVESTAQGAGDFFQELWEAAVAGEGWLPIFLPWYIDPTYRETLTPEAAEELYQRVQGVPYERKLMERCLSVVDRRLSESRRRHFVLEQLQWRRRKIQISCGGSISLFNQENPSTPSEAFISKGETIFDLDATAYYRDNLCCQPRLVGRIVEQYGKPMFVPDPAGCLQVWEEPVPGSLRYCVGADAALGQRAEEQRAQRFRRGGADYSAAVVMSNQYHAVAIYRNRNIDPAEFAEQLALIGRWYNHALLAPEVASNDAGGYGLVFQLRKIYSRIWRWKRFDHFNPGAVTPALGFEITGKAAPLTAPVLIPQGWATMGDLEVGSTVHGRCGWVRVTGVYDRGRLQVYRVGFGDGVTVDAAGDHLWEVIDRPAGQKRRVLTTEEILNQGLQDTAGWRWSVPLLGTPVDFPHRDLPLEPYTLGLLIGNGCFCMGTPMFGSCEMELVDALALPCGAEVRRASGRSKEAAGSKAMDWLLSGPGRKQKNPLTAVLEGLGLWGHRSVQKFIPPMYKYAPYQDRLAMYQGLMDTDGTVDKRGLMSYSTGSYRLAEDVQELVQSFGGLSNIRVKTVKGRDYYEVSANLPRGVAPFRLSRKRERVDAMWSRKDGVTQAHRTSRLRRPIVSIESIGEDVCRCISVDAPDGLYVADNYVLTHNTKSILLQAMMREVRRGAGLVPVENLGRYAKLPPLELYSRELVSELETFSLHRDGGFGSQKGAHDDLAICLGLCLLAVEDLPPPDESDPLLAVTPPVAPAPELWYPEAGEYSSGYDNAAWG